MHDAGLEWSNGKSYLSENCCEYYTSETCYYPSEGQFCYLDYYKRNGYTIYKAEQFLTKNTEIMSTIVNINPYTSEINITPKEGFEIDLENSDLKNGKVVFKEVEKKYPTEFGLDFYRHGNITKKSLSLKYAEKLDLLDILLCLRDEYNRIDGFTEGFRLGEKNWCIENFDGKLGMDLECFSNKIMHFGKEETAELFLKNFEEQLEKIKEFL